MLTFDDANKVARFMEQYGEPEQGSVLQDSEGRSIEGPSVRVNLQYVTIPLPDGGEDVVIQNVAEN